MKVDHHRGSVVECHFRNVRRRNEETFAVERAHLLSPRQPDKPRRGRSAEGRLADMDMSLVVLLRNGRGFDLDAGEPSIHVVPGQHLDHLEIRKRSEQIYAWVLGKPADDFTLPQKTQPLAVSLDRL